MRISGVGYSDIDARLSGRLSAIMSMSSWSPDELELELGVSGKAPCVKEPELIGAEGNGS